MDVKTFLKAAGFGKFRWFRKRHGGVWYKRFSSRTAVEKQIPARHPDAYAADDFSVVLPEDYPGGRGVELAAPASRVLGERRRTAGGGKRHEQ